MNYIPTLVGELAQTLQQGYNAVHASLHASSHVCGKICELAPASRDMQGLAGTSSYGVS